jgi:hypothetical protein
VVTDRPALRLLVDERRMGRSRAALTALGCELAVLLAVVSAPGSAVVLFADSFSGPPGLITNEYAAHHPADAASRLSPDWVVTSGSLFGGGGVATDGAIDRGRVDAASTVTTDSAVFRAYTRAWFEPSYSIRFDARVGPPARPAGAAWDGFHVIVCARSPASAYYVSVARRDGRSVIKKKTAGGPVAGGSYAAVSPYRPFVFPRGRFEPVRIDVTRNDNESVSIDLYVAGRQIVSATDEGSAVYDGAGRIGLRADWTQVWIRDFEVVAG